MSLTIFECDNSCTPEEPFIVIFIIDIKNNRLAFNEKP
jgi:hypothetical protein